jgi:hypothetical protein
LTSDVSAPDIANLNIGQEINLEFESAEVVSLPTTSYPTFTDWIINNAGTLETLQFNNDGTVEDASFKIS